MSVRVQKARGESEDVRQRAPRMGKEEEEERVIAANGDFDFDLDDPLEKTSLRVPSIYAGRRVSSKRSLRSEEHHRYASVRSLFIDFCNRTSSHGVPFFGSHSFFGKVVWVCIFMCCLLSFLIQTYFTLTEYFQYRTIIEMQLKFESGTN